MMTEMEIREMESEEDWSETFPVMKQLRTHLDMETYLNNLREMTEDGYHLFAGFVDDEIVSLIGIGIKTNMYYGRHTWVYELITDADYRSQGYGSELLSFAEEWSEERDCELLALSSGLQREDAHRFYETQMDMNRASYVFKQPLE